METSEILKKVRRIEIRTKGLSRNVFSGHYHSAFKGRGMAFSEVREYQYGDDVRNIDWNVTARFNTPFLKIFEEERELTVMLLMDVSGSNEFGTRSGFKKELMTEVAAVLSFSAIQNNDKVGVLFFSDKVEKFIPPKKGSAHILRIIRELIEFEPESRTTNISEALRYLTNVIKKRCTAFLISDFADQPFEKALRIASGKHDLVAVRVLDRHELEIPDLGVVKIYDREQMKAVWRDTSLASTRRHFATSRKKYYETIDSLFLRTGVDQVKLHTGEDFIKPLMNLFVRRETRNQ